MLKFSKVLLSGSNYSVVHGTASEFTLARGRIARGHQIGDDFRLQFIVLRLLQWDFEYCFMTWCCAIYCLVGYLTYFLSPIKISDC